MAVKINKKIVGYSVLDKDAVMEEEAKPAKVFQLGDPLSRPDQITGSTYKVKTPVTEHALYITINDVLMNEGTKQEHRRPFEIFVNSKNMEHFQWIVALTRVMSAVFRKGGDITFLVEELGSVFDPNGGYYKKGGRYVPSLVAELGQVVEQHLINIGMLKQKKPDQHQQNLIDEKKASFVKDNPDGLNLDSGFKNGYILCNNFMRLF
jgi:hypothetical protein